MSRIEPDVPGALVHLSWPGGYDVLCVHLRFVHCRLTIPGLIAQAYILVCTLPCLHLAMHWITSSFQAKSKPQFPVNMGRWQVLMEAGNCAEQLPSDVCWECSTNHINKEKTYIYQRFHRQHGLPNALILDPLPSVQDIMRVCCFKSPNL